MSSFIEDFSCSLQALLHEVYALRKENAELRDYREKYFDLLHEDIQRNERMMGRLLELRMALRQEREEETQ